MIKSFAIVHALALIVVLSCCSECKESTSGACSQDTQILNLSCDTSPIYPVTQSKKPRHGYVYVVSNKAYGRNVYKIGVTTQRDPNKRIKALQGSGVPYPFRVVYLIESDDVFALERAVHDALNQYRMAENREFFRIKRAVIIDTLKAISAAMGE